MHGQVTGILLKAHENDVKIVFAWPAEVVSQCFFSRTVYYVKGSNAEIREKIRQSAPTLRAVTWVSANLAKPKAPARQALGLRMTIGFIITAAAMVGNRCAYLEVAPTEHSKCSCQCEEVSQ
jgi:hypothetical protein